MRTLRSAFGLAVVVLALYGLGRVTAPAQRPRARPAPLPVKVAQVGSEFEREVVRLTNAERVRRGLRPLTINSKMMADAHKWSVIQAGSRMHHSRMGYGENVAWNQKSPSEVVNVWMNSRGHRANILNSGYTEIGTGYARGARGHMWTQVFR